MSIALEVEDLHYRYPDGTVALRGVSFIIEKGQCVGLVGPNGAGKSTLLHHLNGLLPEGLRDKQPIRIMGEAISPDNLQVIRRRVGILFQNSNDQLICPTLYEEVAFGPRQQMLGEQAVAERVEKALRQAGLEGLEARSPQHMSSGEKRRACIAGILACEPEILLLDHPTSELDTRGVRELKNMIKELTVTRLIATHDLEMVIELCDSVLMMEGGKIVAGGAPAELLANYR